MNEIRDQRRLRLFGSLLALTHILTCYFWISSGEKYIYQLTDSLPLCWPFLEGCESWGRLGAVDLYFVLVVYAVLAAASAFLFLLASWTRTAFSLLAAATVIKIFIFLSDYRLAGNYHYMHFWVLAAFLLIPQKGLTIRFLLLSFYLGAGVLKLNYEWISGAALSGYFPLAGRELMLACGYVVLLELVLVFGLLARRRWIFWLTLAQLALFHALSFLVVGFFYPALMFCFLTLFVLCELQSPGDFHWARIKELRSPARILLGLFFLAQTVPWMIGGDRAVDGRGRLIALNMFDAGTQCELKVMAAYADKVVRLSPQYSGNLQPRLACDPYVMLADARHRCRQLKNDPGFISLEVTLLSKRKTDPGFTTVFAFSDFCAQPRRMDIFGIIR